MQRIAHRTRLALAATAVAMAPLLTAALATSSAAAPAPAPSPLTQARASADGSALQRVEQTSPRELNLYVHSAAMDRTIQLEVIRAKDTSTPRPTLYLLNGAGGGEDAATWQAQTDVATFFQDKNVNVITPVGGAFSYYTDWEKDDPALGRNKWTTFLTQELPPIADSALGASGVNSLVGLSMAGTSVLALAEQAPGLYKSVGAYSGCAQTSTKPGSNYVQVVVGMRGGSDVENMWGPVGGPDWVKNDPYVHADKLRGTRLYISSGTGLPGPHDNLGGPGIDGRPITLADQLIIGGGIEAITNQCTHKLADKLHQLNIPATFNFPPTGTHSWGYWQDDLHRSWPMIAQSMGI